MKKILSILAILLFIFGCAASKKADLSFNQDISAMDLAENKQYCKSIMLSASKLVDEYLERVNGKYELVSYNDKYYLMPSESTNNNMTGMVMHVYTWYGSDNWYKNILVYFDYEEKNGNVYFTKITLEDENGEDKIIYKK